ncbi:hypothetical protein Agub_g11397, partial [Astrephomene gubernaculifera]
MSCQLLGRTPDGIQLLTIGEQDGRGLCGSSSGIMCTADGSKLVCSSPDGVKLVDLDSGQQVSQLPEAGVVLAALSSSGDFLVTCTRPGKEADGSMSKNLKVWDLGSCRCVFSLAQKQVSKDAWPVLHWAHDDSVFVHAVTNTVHVYSRADGFSAYRKLSIKGIGGLALSPAPPSPPSPLPLLAAFLPEAKGTPAAAALVRVGEAGEGEPHTLVRKSFFRTQGAKLMWNSPGTA